MNALAKKLGLEPTLRFYDVYSLDDEELLALIPRPVYALLVILPLTRAWDEERRREDEGREKEGGVGGLSFPLYFFSGCYISLGGISQEDFTRELTTYLTKQDLSSISRKPSATPAVLSVSYIVS
jgi:hypothetical protein